MEIEGGSRGETERKPKGAEKTKSKWTLHSVEELV